MEKEYITYRMDSDLAFATVFGLMLYSKYGTPNIFCYDDTGDYTISKEFLDTVEELTSEYSISDFFDTESEAYNRLIESTLY